MAGTGDQWTDWLEQHGAALVLFARQTVPSVADAEDVVQSAFVRFWRSRHRASDPKAYLYVCVKRSALDFLRDHRRRKAREDAAASRRSPTVEPLFVLDPENYERQVAVEVALARLESNQREVLFLKIWAGLTFSEIGQTLEISPNTAASRYRYALDALRNELSEELIK
jgi:RNA polymerase sigma-70 factor (ECF subfamily)